MVTRRIGGAVAPTFRSPLVAALLLSVSVFAQDPQPASSPQPAGAPPQSQPAAPAAESAPQDAAPVYGKVLGERVQLRCWPAEVASPPMFEDVLLKDQIVRLGAAEEGFRSVVLPLGPIGYVSKRFTEQADDGTVTTHGEPRRVPLPSAHQRGAGRTASQGHPGARDRRAGGLVPGPRDRGEGVDQQRRRRGRVERS